METIKTPVYVGGYNISGSKDINQGIVILKTSKPMFIHRFFSKILLDWVWIDY